MRDKIETFSVMPARKKVRFKEIFLILLCFAGVSRLIQMGVAGGTDFGAYWKAAQAWWAGKSPYFFDTKDAGYVFKYPIWSLPLFLPFGKMNFEHAKNIWVLIQLFMLIYSIRKLIRLKLVDWKIGLGVGLLFWWTWLGHIYSGQFTLVLLATSLWILPRPSFLRLTMLLYIFSIKVFSIVSLAGLWRSWVKLRVLTLGLSLWLALHFIVMIHFPSWEAIRNLYADWLLAAFSGKSEFGAEVIRGQNNHGFPALVLRIIDPQAFHENWDSFASLISAVVLGALWHILSKKLPDNEKWFGWLAVGVVTHPLAWHHSYVLLFPLSAVTLNLAYRKKELIKTTLFAIAMSHLIIPQTVGLTLVRPLELAGLKFWGTVLLAACLVRLRKRGFLSPGH